MRYVIVLICLLFALCGCSRSQESLPINDVDHFSFSNFVLGNSELEKCSPLNAAETIELAERGLFLNRRTNDLVTRPIDVFCVRTQYSYEEISDQASRGDPVAMLAKIDAGIKNKSQICNQRNKIIPILKNISESSILYNQDDIKRVPEAYYIIGGIMSFCGDPGWEAYYSNSIVNGYDPISQHGPSLG